MDSLPRSSLILAFALLSLVCQVGACFCFLFPANVLPFIVGVSGVVAQRVLHISASVVIFHVAISSISCLICSVLSAVLSDNNHSIGEADGPRSPNLCIS